MTIYGKGCISNYRNCSLSYVWYSVLYRMLTHQHCFVSSRYPLITVLTSDLTLVFLWASACITTFGSGDFTSWKKVSSKSFAF